MSAEKATLLTLEQEALIPVYQAKWREITLSTKPIDSTVATSLLGDLYVRLGLSRPNIRFFDSPYAALSSGIFDRAGHSIRCQLENRLESLLWALLKQEPLLQDFEHQLWRLTGSQVASNLGFLLQSQLEEQLADYPQKWLWNQLDNCLQPQLWQDCHGSWFDFFISVLNYAHNERTWALLQTLGQHSGWFFPYHDLSVVCGRPSKLLLDDENQFHAEGEPAIQFADGFGVYVYHGVRLPQKYGELLPSQWRTQWILEETDPDLKRVLMQGIGYLRICQELSVTQLNIYQDGNLITSEVDALCYRGLQITCPNTGASQIMWVECSAIDVQATGKDSQKALLV